MMGLEDILDKAVVFTEVKTSAFGGYYACGVLASVLEDGETVEDGLVDVGVFVCEE